MNYSHKFSYTFLILALIMFIGCSGKQLAENSIGEVRETKDKKTQPFIAECLRLATSIEGKVPGWELVSPVYTYNKEDIFDYINGAAELYFAYDFRAVVAAEYKNNETSIMVDVYDMTNSEGAFGIYSLNRYQGANYVDIGNDGILSGTALEFWKGNYFCKVYAFDMSPKYQDEVKKIGNLLASEIKEAGSEPSIIKDLPQNGLIPRSAKFFTRKLGMDNIRFISPENLLGLSENTKGVVANYELENQKFQVFMIRYPSSNEADSAFKAYSEFLNESLSSEIIQENINIFKSNGKFIGIYLKDRVLSGFWDADTREIAELVILNVNEHE